MSAPARGAVVVVGDDHDRVALVWLDAAGAETARATVSPAELPAQVAEIESGPDPVRWVWDDTPRRYPALLAAGTRVARCRDLRLCHAILRDSALVRPDSDVRVATAWDAPTVLPDTSRTAQPLFELDATAPVGVPSDVAAAVAEFRRQSAAQAASEDPRRLTLLCAAESAGALVAAEMQAAGLPWDADAHRAILTELLGAPDATGEPARLRELRARVRAALGVASLDLDSPAKLLHALRDAGVCARTTSRRELADHDHPVIAPLLEYKRLYRLHTADGAAWLAHWVHDGRFRPVYIPSGVVTGRWASNGGGALQIPRRLREAIRADPGWTFVVADVAQLEPRVLAAMSGDLELAAAARGHDLYAGIVQRGTVGARAEAKVALLGAMYGATTGDSGRLVPRLRRAYPRAMALVDDAARAGEQGRTVSTWLGRTSPPPSDTWWQVQRTAARPDATAPERDRARRAAGDWGRFTRNFVVQGTAAEWALAWLGNVRTGLSAMGPVEAVAAAPRSGSAFARVPHLAFFLHDELIVHTPRRYADEAAAVVRDGAAAAAQLLFGAFPLDFPLDLRVTGVADK